MTDPRVGQTILAFADTIDSFKDTLGSFAGHLRQIWGQPEPNTQSQPVGGTIQVPPSDARHDTHMTMPTGGNIPASVIPGPAAPLVESHSAVPSSEQPQNATTTVEPPNRPVRSSATPSVQRNQDSQQSANLLPRPLPEEDHAPVTPQTTATTLSSSQRKSVRLCPQPDTVCLPCIQRWKKRLETKEELIECIHGNNGCLTCTQCTKKRSSAECKIKSTKAQTETLKRLKFEYEQARQKGGAATTEAASLEQEVQKVIQLLEITHQSPSKSPKKRTHVKTEPSGLSEKRQRIPRPATPRPTPTSAPPSESDSDVSMKSESTADDNLGLSMVAPYEHRANDP